MWRTVVPGLQVAEAPQGFLGLEVGARMTALETSRGWVVHSPLDQEPGLGESGGEIAAVVCPNKLHHLYAGRWLATGAPGFAAPGLPEKRRDLPFAGVLDGTGDPLGPDVAVFPMRCFAMTNEVVLLHKPTRTLVVTDLVFHFGPSAPWVTRAAMTCLCGYPGCSMTLLERFGFDRAVARQEIGELLAQDFDRLIMAHGEIIETGGRGALWNASRWLWPAGTPAP
jgi:hypothetical protein